MRDGVIREGAAAEVITEGATADGATAEGAATEGAELQRRVQSLGYGVWVRSLGAAFVCGVSVQSWRADSHLCVEFRRIRESLQTQGAVLQALSRSTRHTAQWVRALWDGVT